MCFHLYWLCTGGRCLPRDWYTTCFCSFFTMSSSKIEVFKTVFFCGIVTTHNDHPSYVKHVLGSIYVLFTLFGYWVRGVSPKVHNLLMQL